MVWYNHVIPWYGIIMSYHGMVWYYFVIPWYGITMSYCGMVGMVYYVIPGYGMVLLCHTSYHGMTLVWYGYGMA